MKKRNGKFGLVFIFALVIVLLVLLWFKSQLPSTQMTYLSYMDLHKLCVPQELKGTLYRKLQRQLTIPYVAVSGQDPAKGWSASGGKSYPYNSRRYLRIAHWNIERGFKVDEIKRFVKNPKGKEQNDFAKADVISLNEVDVGMPRTQYRNVVGELARTLNYDYAFATEFIELNPLIYKQKVDPMRYLGLHGSAILSRYPIKSVSVIRLPECYRWFEAEITKKSPLEYARRFGAKTVFNEPILSEVRRGGRCALVADIGLPNMKTITVVSTHLEDRCYPDCRLRQLQYLLNNLRHVRTPLVLAGDFNTSTTDTAPTSVKKEIVKRLRDPHFIARQLVFAAIPGGSAGGLASVGLGKLFQYKDPAVPSIPIFFPNQERKLFTYLKDFYFSDGEAFDFSGDPQRSSNGKSGLLANSNERQLKGFESTFKFEEPRVIAYFKLDWFFVKPKGNRFKPFNGQTLKFANQCPSGKISDHDPITVDLTL